MGGRHSGSLTGHGCNSNPASGRASRRGSLSCCTGPGCKEPATSPDPVPRASHFPRCVDIHSVVSQSISLAGVTQEGPGLNQGQKINCWLTRTSLSQGWEGGRCTGCCASPDPLCTCGEPTGHTTVRPREGQTLPSGQSCQGTCWQRRASWGQVCHREEGAESRALRGLLGGGRKEESCSQGCKSPAPAPDGGLNAYKMQCLGSAQELLMGSLRVVPDSDFLNADSGLLMDMQSGEHQPYSPHD